MMTDQMHRASIRCLTRFMRHPITKPFSSPPSATFNMGMMSPQVIDLNVVKARLLGRTYFKVQQFIDDMEEIWRENERVYANDKYKVIAANENRRIWGKIKKDLEISSMDKWCHSVFDGRTSLVKNIFTANEEIKKLCPTLTTCRTATKGDPTEIINEKEAIELISLISKLKSEDDQRNMVKLIIDRQPELENGGQELIVNVFKLKQETRKILLEYIKKALE